MHSLASHSLASVMGVACETIMSAGASLRTKVKSGSGMWSTVFITLGIAACGLLVWWKWLRKIWIVATDLLLQWWVLTGPTYSRSYPKPLRILPFLCDPRDLDEVTLHEVCDFQRKFFDLERVERAVHIKKLKYYSHIVLLRDRMDGCLRGTFLFKVTRHGSHTFLQGGLSTLALHYKRGPYLWGTTFLLALKELFAHPLTPLYLMIKSYGIESYLMVNKMPNTFPRYDKPTPESLKRVCEEWVQAEMASGEKYNRDTCVLERTLSHVKQHVSQVDALDRRNPHIAFFLKTNPGYRQGHCLVSCLNLKWSDLPRVVWELGMKSLGKKKGPHAVKKWPPLFKRMTFQDSTANRIQEEQMSRSSAAAAGTGGGGGGETNGTTASAGEGGEEGNTKKPAHMLLSQLSAEVELDVNLDTLSV